MVNYYSLQQQQQRRPFNGLWSGTTRVGRYQKKYSPTHTHPDHRASFITFLHSQRSTASSLFNLRAWQSSRTTSFQVFFGLPLGLEPSTSCSIHFFTQSSSSFRNTWHDVIHKDTDVFMTPAYIIHYLKKNDWQHPQSTSYCLSSKEPQPQGNTSK